MNRKLISRAKNKYKVSFNFTMFLVGFFFFFFVKKRHY